MAVFWATGGVANESLKNTRCVEVGGGVASECTITDRRIAYAGGVELECKSTYDAVLMASGIVSECIGSKCTVEKFGRFGKTKPNRFPKDSFCELAKPHGSRSKELRTFLLQKCFGYGIGESLTLASQQEVVVRFPKQLKREELSNVLPEIFELRSGNSLARAQPQRDPLHALHFVRQIFARSAC